MTMARKASKRVGEPGGRGPNAKRSAKAKSTGAPKRGPKGERNAKKRGSSAGRRAWPASGRSSGRATRAAAGRPPRTGGRRFPARTSSARSGKDGAPVRLNKFLADCGVGSRRGCDELIAGGKVTIDGMPVTALGTRVDPTSQRVEVEGFVLRLDSATRRYYLLNKPAGVVCTNERRETRPRAIDLITDSKKGRIYTVGRLDEESKGLILLTNDGEFGQRISHPRYGVHKSYRVRVQGRIEDPAVQKIRDGVHLSEGRTSGARVILKRRTQTSSTLLVILREGMNREIRRSFARVGHRVTDLVRTEIGPLTTRGLRVGRWRALSRAEVEALLDASRRGRPRRPGSKRRVHKREGRRGDTRGAKPRTKGGAQRGRRR